MSQAAEHRLTLEGFLQWQEGSEHRFELVDGRPVAMTGATFGYDRVVGNILTELKLRLRRRGSGCDSFTADIGVVTGPQTLRRPDVAVYCPPFDDASLRSASPRLVAEVLSPSTRDVGQAVKLAEYQALSSLRHILLVNPEEIDAVLWSRGGDGVWSMAEYTRDSETIGLDDLGIELPLSAVYERTGAKPAYRPRLIWPDPPPAER